MGETKVLLDVLRAHYIKPSANPAGGIFIPECGINGPLSQSRADALYVGFTSTSGRLLVGHEIKVSRADWRRELDNAGKADFWADACHEWWIVAPGPEVVPVDEVPAGWGLMYPGPRLRMKVAKKAVTHMDRHPAWDATRSIMARLDTLQSQALLAQAAGEQERVQAEVARLREYDKQRASAESLTDETRARLNALDRVERKLGESLSGGWDDDVDELDPETLVACLRLARGIRAMGIDGLRQDRYDTERLRERAQNMLDGLDLFGAARSNLLALVGDDRG